MKASDDSLGSWLVTNRSLTSVRVQPHNCQSLDHAADRGVQWFPFFFACYGVPHQNYQAQQLRYVCLRNCTFQTTAGKCLAPGVQEVSQACPKKRRAKGQAMVTGHTVDGPNPAPPKKPCNYDSPVNTNKQWYPMVSK